MNYYYNTLWRMDWGFGNPNKTAALIALLMITVWAIAYVKKGGFWLSLILFTILSGCLIHTFSRGGIMAASLGMMPLLYFRKGVCSRNRIIGVSISICLILCVLFLLGLNKRLEGGLVTEDDSISNRLLIWKAAPQMMIDAPMGWGIGRSGEAYMQWYQPTDRTETYRTLVNSHLTYLVEVSWPIRILYIIGWLSVLWICWPDRTNWLFTLSFGIWIAFMVAAIFSSIEESVLLWIIPIVGTGVCIMWRFRNNKWPHPMGLVIATAGILGCSAISLALLSVYNKSNISYIGNATIIGNGDPSIWIVVDSKIMGHSYGHSLRRHLLRVKNENAVGIVTRVQNLPLLSGKTVVLAGAPVALTKASTLGTAQKVILLNPSFVPQEIQPSIHGSVNIAVFFGQFSSSPAIASWTSLGSIQEVKGCGNFLPDWPSLIF